MYTVWLKPLRGGTHGLPCRGRQSWTEDSHQPLGHHGTRGHTMATLKWAHSSSLSMVMSRWQEASVSSRIYCSARRSSAESSHNHVNLSSADLRLKCLASHSTHCNAVCVCTLQGSKVTHVTELHNGFRRRSVRQVKDDIPLGLI